MPSAAATQLPAALTSARAARAFIRDSLGSLVDPDVLDTVELLTSEVVTNALLHAGAAPVVALTRPGGRIRVSVEDSSTHWPVRRNVAPTAIAGRGVALVDALASSWGVELLPGAGKRVWFEVSDLH